MMSQPTIANLKVKMLPARPDTNHDYFKLISRIFQEHSSSALLDLIFKLHTNQFCINIYSNQVI